MAYSETTGLLEINRNRQGRSFSVGDVGTSPDLLEHLLGLIRKDIGLTRAEAIELDKRRHT